MDTALLTHPGFIGGMLGAFLGLLGGIFGTWRSYRRARSRKERSWILFYAVAILLFCLGALWLILGASSAGRIIYWIIYPFCLAALCIGIPRHLNRLHTEGQDENAGRANPIEKRDAEED